MRKIAKFTFIGLLASLPVIRVSSVYATGIPVVDALSVAKSVISNINEAMMIKNQVEQLANDMKNLTSLDFSILDEYSEQLTSFFEKMGEVHGLMQELGDLEAKFEELYPDFHNLIGEFDEAKASEAIFKALDESRQQMLGAAKVGQKVLENMPRTQAQLEELISDSQSAPGILQATQAGNQINATISGNLMTLNGLMAQFVQTYTSYMQKENMKEAIEIKRKEKLLAGKKQSTEPPVPMKPF